MRRDETTDPEGEADKNKNYNSGLEGDYNFQLTSWDTNIGADWVYRGADFSSHCGRQHRNDYAGFVQVKKTFMDRLTATVGSSTVLPEPGTMANYCQASA
jgi:hypothetical protein